MNHNAIENYIPEHVKAMLAQLNDLEATSEAALCGGALRDLYLGGEVSDWDIFCTVRSGDLETISNIFYIVSSLGFTISHSHGNGYVDIEDTASLVVDKFFDAYLIKEKKKPKNIPLLSRTSLERWIEKQEKSTIGQLADFDFIDLPAIDQYRHKLEV